MPTTDEDVQAPQKKPPVALKPTDDEVRFEHLLRDMVAAREAAKAGR